MSCRIGMVGGRGYVGEALMGLLQRHPRMELAWASSRSLAGRSIASVFPELDSLSLDFESLGPEQAAARPVDVVVLALANGEAAPYVKALQNRQARILDVSADYRLDDRWTYGLPELHRDRISEASAVANPGCYATGACLALEPVRELLDQAPRIFGVSGYSGAGRTPGPRNDPERLCDNLVPYSLSGHVHEREIGHHLGQAVRFHPHVAGFFRGISLTLSLRLQATSSASELLDRFQSRFADEALVEVGEAIPEIREIRDLPTLHIGGFDVDARDARNVSWVCCLDNLLKGAASQAMQNLNLMCGLAELEGLSS